MTCFLSPTAFKNKVVMNKDGALFCYFESKKKDGLSIVFNSTIRITCSEELLKILGCGYVFKLALYPRYFMCYQMDIICTHAPLKCLP